MAQIDGMRERTVIVTRCPRLIQSPDGASVTASLPEITSAIRKVHDFPDGGRPRRLASRRRLRAALPPSYYDQLTNRLPTRRDLILPELESAASNLSARTALITS
jgi:hypothetical protein